MEIHIISGFLGAGKTTFLNQYLPLLSGKTAVIENEFGDVGLDGDLIREKVPVRELYAGCICCTLAIDFRQSIREIAETYRPDRIVIEPSGIGKLSDVIKACEDAREKDGVELLVTRRIVIVDGEAYEESVEGFGAFYLDQIRNAQMLFVSWLEGLEKEKQEKILTDIREQNQEALIYAGDFRQLDGQELLHLLELSEQKQSGKTVDEQREEDVFSSGILFSSISFTDLPKISKEEMEKKLENLRTGKYGRVLRVKGLAETPNGERYRFDLTPGHMELKTADPLPGDTGERKAVIIGTGLDRAGLETLFLGKQKVRLPKKRMTGKR